MPQKGQVSVTLPENLFDEVKDFVKKNHRWTNPTEFVKEAVRLRLEQLQTKQEVKARA